MPGKSTNLNTKKGRRPDIVQDWAPAFFDALAKGASVTDAANAAGVHYTLPYKRRVKDKEFEKEWNEVALIGTEVLEGEAIRRAFHGVDEPIYYKGVEVGTVKRYSDPLMMMILKGRKPHVYREGMEENSGIGRGVTLNINIVQVEHREPEKVTLESEVLPLDVKVIDGE